MNYSFIGILLLFLTVTGQVIGPEKDEVAGAVTVMSYNIRYDNPNDGDNSWPNRKDHVAEMIGSKYSADIAGLQEVLVHQLRDLENRLPDYGWVGVGRDDGYTKGEFSPILYRKDKFELVATNTFWLSKNPEIPGSTSWDTAITRIVTWAKFKNRADDREFYVFNTHFDHRGNIARTESAKIIADKVSGLNEHLPIIITGDFNVSERSEAYKIITETDGLYDARYISEAGHEGPTASSNNWEEMRGQESRIDYIFVNDYAKINTHHILDDRYNGYFPSDHLPVLAKIMFMQVSE